MRVDSTSSEREQGCDEKENMLLLQARPPERAHGGAHLRRRAQPAAHRADLDHPSRRGREGNLLRHGQVGGTISRHRPSNGRRGPPCGKPWLWRGTPTGRRGRGRGGDRAHHGATLPLPKSTLLQLRSFL